MKTARSTTARSPSALQRLISLPLPSRPSSKQCRRAAISSSRSSRASSRFHYFRCLAWRATHKRAFCHFYTCVLLCFSVVLTDDWRARRLRGAAGPAIYFKLCESMKVHGGDAATTGHLCRRQGRRRGSPSAARKCARIDHPSGRDDTIAWPCGARRVRHLRGPVPKRRASAVPATRIPPHENFRRAYSRTIASLLHGACLFQLISILHHITVISKYHELLFLSQHHLPTAPQNERFLSALLSLSPSRSATHALFFLLKLNLRETPRSFSRRSPNSSVVRRGR